MDSDLQELQSRREKAMGIELGKRYNMLWNELVWLKWKLDQQNTLFGHSEERVDLLNKVGRRFFGDLESTMWRDILLHLTRLTEANRFGGHERLTIQGMDEFIRDDEITAAEVRDLAREAAIKSRFAKRLRNERLAHNDLAVKLDPVGKVMEIDMPQVKEAVASIETLLNRVHQKFFGRPDSFFVRPLAYGAAEDLIHYLEAGVRSMQQEREEWIRGIAYQSVDD